MRHTFSRSYGAILPSSLAKVISTPWNSLPTYLCWFTVRAQKLARLEAFLGSMESFTTLHPKSPRPITSRLNGSRDLPREPSYMLGLPIPSGNGTILLRPPIAQTLIFVVQEY